MGSSRHKGILVRTVLRTMFVSRETALARHCLWLSPSMERFLFHVKQAFGPAGRLSREDLTICEPVSRGTRITFPDPTKFATPFHVKQAFRQRVGVKGAGRDGSLFHVEQRFSKGAIRSRDTDNWFKSGREWATVGTMRLIRTNCMANGRST